MVLGVDVCDRRSTIERSVASGLCALVDTAVDPVASVTTCLMQRSRSSGLGMLRIPLRSRR